MKRIPIFLMGCFYGVSSSLSAVSSPFEEWTGIYLGINGGYVTTHNKAQTHLSNIMTLPSPSSSPGLAASTSIAGGSFSISSHDEGFIGGGQFGASYLLKPFVVGIETDIQGIAPNDHSRYASHVYAIPGFTTSKIASNLVLTHGLEYLGTLRGRFGILATPSLLLAASGGYAYGGSQTVTELTQSYLGTANNLMRTFMSEGGASHIQKGWTVGGSLEWKIYSQWSTKLEYLYYDLGSVSYDASPLVSLINSGQSAGQSLFANAVSVTSRYNGQLIRVGVNYWFAS
ncbi:Opacity protein and related surface antigens [Legionella wadsworthii]|uniref:Opacity protein and related surface antigens n=1 Tax=Legionella wadsworthii TaxID=28088 RepID=A0A378LPW6_9GAMM|nr:outer membrane beta-barrel protein [Legionella wadsworthii]STY27902.1 Opacity protein and related surface antigens [Legionella wadsworthii]